MTRMTRRAGAAVASLGAVFAFAAAPAYAADEVITGTSGGDAIVVTASSAVDASYTVNGGVPTPLTDVTSLTVNAGDGNDVVKIVNPDGGLFVPPSGIQVNGEAQSGPPGDSLEQIGGAASSSSYTPRGTDSGTFEHTGASGTQTIEFTGLEPATDTVAATDFAYNLTPDANTITIDNGAVNGDGQLRIAVDAFETIEFANKTNVTVDGQGGDDTATITATEVATGMATLTVDLGNDTGDTITPTGVNLPGVSVRLLGGGQILDGGPGVDLTALNLAARAGSFVGTPGNPLDTEVANIEASSNTGGIFIAEDSSVTVGGVLPSFQGLQGGTSGTVSLNTNGPLLLGDLNGTEIVKAGTTSGDVILAAGGAGANLEAVVDRDAIIAPRGTITATAGQDIEFGTGGADFDNDVRADGSVTLQAGRAVLLDGFADVFSDDFGNATGSDLVVNAGEDIALLQATGADATMGAQGTAGADVHLTTGADDFLHSTAPSPNAIFSNSGSVFVNADRIVIGATSGITASSGSITLAPATAARLIQLGTVGDFVPTRLELSDAELDRMATDDLIVGRPDADRHTVTASVSPATATSLEMIGAGGFDGQPGGSITEDSLTLTDTSPVGRTWTQTATSLNAGGGLPFLYTAGDLTLNGDGNDIFDVDSTPAGTNTAINAGPGDDAVNLGALSNILDGIQGPLDIDGQAGTGDTLELRDQSDIDPNTYSLAAGQASRNGTAAITYTGIESLDANGGTSADTFNVKASPDTAYDLDANAPATAPGDTLNYDTEGRDVGGDTSPPSGTITSPGVRDVVFSDFEGLVFQGVPLPPVPGPDPACGPLEPNIVGTDGDDSLVGTSGDDIIAGGLGNDTIRGGGGDDVVCGGAGEDEIRGGAGDDRLRGNRDDDTVRGGAGNDFLGGGNRGNDALFGGSGRDRCRGGGGSDTANGCELLAGIP